MTNRERVEANRLADPAKEETQKARNWRPGLGPGPTLGVSTQIPYKKLPVLF
jgi:hypothetical protein